eukprot:scaffold13449_cov28-Tisochrysis_lutea.AAC.2
MPAQRGVNSGEWREPPTGGRRATSGASARRTTKRRSEAVTASKATGSCGPRVERTSSIFLAAIAAEVAAAAAAAVASRRERRSRRTRAWGFPPSAPTPEVAATSEANNAFGHPGKRRRLKMAWSAIPAGSASALGRRRVRSADGAISTKTMAAAGAAHANDVLDDDPSMTQIEKDAGTVPRAQFVAAAPDRAPTLSPVVIRLVLSLKPCAAWTASPLLNDTASTAMARTAPNASSRCGCSVVPSNADAAKGAAAGTRGAVHNINSRRTSRIGEKRETASAPAARGEPGSSCSLWVVGCGFPSPPPLSSPWPPPWGTLRRNPSAANPLLPTLPCDKTPLSTSRPLIPSACRLSWPTSDA